MKPGHPVILYVPGLLPKPEPEVHCEALKRCLLTGLRRVDSAVAESIEATAGSFDIVSWTFDFYGEHRDFELDRASIEAVIAQPVASKNDIAEAMSWMRRLTRWVYRLGDLLPFIIPALATERMEVHLRDLRRYERNRNGIGDHVRRMLKVALHAAANGRHPVLLIGHSMGSIISYDALWELSHEGSRAVDIDTFLTMGSPLGQNLMQRQINGHDQRGVERYPTNVRRWKNLSAVGDLTAIDACLASDFGEMIELGLVESIDDDEVFNYFRLDGELNVHSEYGYLVNEKTALTIAAWWRSHT
ncbi:MAG: hypothetical protein K0U72_14210 [Gammaproteobacteria bacterium]|nr:hypothetical protein [Gammaproteobacteria bacterium]